MTQAEAIERFKQACATAALISRHTPDVWRSHVDDVVHVFTRNHSTAEFIMGVVALVEEANDRHLKLTTINQERRTP